MPRTKKDDVEATTKKKAVKKATKKATTKSTTKKATTKKTSSKAVMTPEVNIGLVGHVDHGKTTLTKTLSGLWTDTHSEELKRGITIRLGYADTTFYKDSKGIFTVQEKDEAGKENTPVRKISFVDAPGHETLMATMLAGSNIMDGALLLVSANEVCPQPQTREHLTALEIMGIKNIVIVQNKIDLVTPEDAKANYDQIREFVKGSVAENAPIVPISAIHKANIDTLIEVIEETIPTPKRESSDDLVLHIARSFDINKPGSNPSKIVGGVLGGAIVSGDLKVGESIEIRPGKKVEFEGKTTYHPISTVVVGLKTGSTSVDNITPGGSVGVMTELDPSIVKSDALTGSVVGRPGNLPPTWDEFTLETNLLERVVGAKDELVVDPIKMREPLMLNVNSAATVGVVLELKKGQVFTKLKLPVCAPVGSRVTISRMVGNRWRLIGYGIIKE